MSYNAKKNIIKRAKRDNPELSYSLIRAIARLILKHRKYILLNNKSHKK